MNRKTDAIRIIVSNNIAITESFLVFYKHYLEPLEHVFIAQKRKRL